MSAKIETTLDSRTVAEMVGKGHKELLRDIRRYMEQLGGESNIALSDFFKPSTYLSEQSKAIPCFEVTRKGCEFIAHKLTGVKGSVFTAQYINAFHDMETVLQEPKNNVPSTLDFLKAELQLLERHEKALEAMDQRVDSLENNMVIDHGQERQLARLVNGTVCGLLGGRKSPAYMDKTLRSRVYSRLNHDFFDYFNVNARGNTPAVRFTEACEYVQAWQPDTNLKLDIRAAS